MAPVVRLGADALYHLRQLVHALAAVVRVHVRVLCAKVSPLEAIHRTQVPLLSAPPLGAFILPASSKGLPASAGVNIMWQ